MRTGEYLTIQDYFRNATGRASASWRMRPSSAVSATESGDFLKGLESAKAAMRGSPSRLGIQDYFRKPLHFRPVASLTMPVSLPSKASFSAHAVPPPEIAVPAKTHADRDQTEPPGDRATIDATIRRAAVKYKLSPALLHAVVKAESNYNARAVSPAGAQGLMQLMPGTADELGVDDPFNIEQNIDGGARYLRRMLNQFDGNVEQALSAYNAGPGTVLRYNGKVPYAETQTYVSKVLRYADRFSRV